MGGVGQVVVFVGLEGSVKLVLIGFGIDIVCKCCCFVSVVGFVKLFVVIFEVVNVVDSFLLEEFVFGWLLDGYWYDCYCV